ncbi:MAG: hypothetical protein ACK4RK_19405, partial [Gemmataceae bacterium]
MAVVVPPSGIGGVREDATAVKRLREDTGNPVERYPNGAFKTSLAWVKLGSDRYERWTHFDGQGGKWSEYKTPAREFTEKWDTAKGWVPGDVVRDQTTLAARWGLPAVGWPYYAVGVGLVAAGLTVLFLPFARRPKLSGGLGM